MQNFFSAHPASVGETYWQHMAVALKFSFALFSAAFAALIHAFFPALFETTASQQINRLHDQLVRNRQNRNASIDVPLQAKMAETPRQI